MEGDDSPDGSSVDAASHSTNVIKDNTSKKASELALQLGAMTLKNIVQETEGGPISIQDLCDQFAARAKLKEQEAVGLDVSEVLVSLNKYPGMFVILEGGESDKMKVQLAENTSIPSLLSGILKITGILKTKGSLSMDDLNRYFSKSCTEDEKTSLGENAELLKETLLSLPNVLRVSGDTVSMVVEKEFEQKEGADEQPSVKADECQATEANEVSNPIVSTAQDDKLEDLSNETEAKEVSNPSVSTAEDDKLEDLSNETEAKEVSNSSVSTAEDDKLEDLSNETMAKEVSNPSVSNAHDDKLEDLSKKTEDGDESAPEQLRPEEISKSEEENENEGHLEQHSVEEPENDVQDVDIELMASSNEYESDDDIDVDVEEMEKEASDFRDEQSALSSQSSMVNGVQLDMRSETNSSAEICISETSNQMPEASGPPESEQSINLHSKLAKELGILKIKQILQEKSPISIQQLGTLFGGRASAEERDAVGRKAKGLVETAQEFDDVFTFQTFPERGETLWDQMYIHLKSVDNNNEDSLAFARAVLKIQDILEQRGSLKMTQLSTFLNQTSTAEERNSVGKGPPTLKQTLLALTGLFQVLDDYVCIVKGKQTTSKKPAADAVPAQPQEATNIPTQHDQFNDFSNVNLHLGILTIKAILEENGPTIMQNLCSRFGNQATDDERDAVGRKANEVLNTLKKFHQVFFIKSPKDGSSDHTKTKVRLVKGGGANQTSAPYAKAIFKVIWYLKERGTMDVTRLSSRLGQNSTPSEREAVGKSPGELKKTLRSLPKLFGVSSSNITIVGNEPHVIAAKLFILPSTPVTQPRGQQPLPNEALNIASTVIRCLQEYNGSCDLTRITQWINTSGSSAEKKKYGSNPKEMLQHLKTLPRKFQCQGTKVYLVNYRGDRGANLSSISNPTPMQGVGISQSPTKVIPSIEIVFDTKNGHGDRWRNVTYSQAVNQSQDLGSASTNNNPPSTSSDANKPITKSRTALKIGLGRITTYLEQVKIATVIQLGGVNGSKGSAAEREKVGKNPGLLYDTLASLPDRFAMAGPFVGVKDQQDFVTGVANLVTFLESKGRCEIALLFGKLIQSGTAKQQAALGTDIDTFTATIEAMSGVFTLYTTSVYLNNGTEGKPHAKTNMDKTTAVNQNVPWALSTGTKSAQSAAPSTINQNAATSEQRQDTDSTASSVPLPLASRLGNPSLTLIEVSISDYALCQEFKQNCLDKYDYPIVGLAVDKNKHIAIAGWEGCVYLFNMEGAAPSMGGMEILRDVICNTKILKVVHNCENISATLHQTYGFKLHNIFDTKIAYQLQSGHSAVTLTKLCNEYGVATPDKWKIIVSCKRGAAGGSVGQSLDGSLGVKARVLIPQIYQHMVMKISADNLQEVGKLCEERSVLSYQTVSPVSNLPSLVTIPPPTFAGNTNHLSARASSSPSSEGNSSLSNEELSTKVDGDTVSKSVQESVEIDHDLKEDEIHDDHQERDPTDDVGIAALSISEQTNEAAAAATAGAASGLATPALNPWGITQQLKEQFTAKNKQDMDALKVLGEDIAQHLTRLAEEDPGKLDMLTEIILDSGRFANARFYQKDSSNIGYTGLNVSSSPITQEDIQSIMDSDLVTTPTPDKRAGIEGTLHRLGLIYNRSGRAIGLTSCIGRAVLGCVDHIYDLIHNGQSVVLLGRPGVGMTTVLREMARILSDAKGRRVVVIDTYNQIGGDSDVPHPAIGSARRLQVASRTEQHLIMEEAVKSHSPQTIILDEMSTMAEAQATRNLVQRGVQVIAAAHASNFVDFVQNHEYQHVTGMGGSQGAEVSGRQAPAFQVLIELCERDLWVVHKDLATSVDLYSQGIRPFVEERQCTWHRSRRGNLIGPVWKTRVIEAQIPLPKIHQEHEGLYVNK